MDIIEILSTLPLFWKITLIILVILGNIAVSLRKEIGMMFGHQKRKKITRKSLYEHKLFIEKGYIFHKIDLIEIDNVKKRKIFKALLQIKYNAILRNASLLIKEDYEISNRAFYGKVIENLTTIISDYNREFKQEFGEEIFNLIMNDKDRGFNAIHEKTTAFIKGTVEESFSVDHLVPESNLDRVDFLLDLYYVAIKLAITDITKLFSNFNGDLDKLIKKNKI